MVIHLSIHMGTLGLRERNAFRADGGCTLVNKSPASTLTCLKCMVLSLLNTYSATSFLQLLVTRLLSGRYFPLTHRTIVVKIPKKSSSCAFAPLCRVNPSVVFGDPWDAVFKVFV